MPSEWLINKTRVTEHGPQETVKCLFNYSKYDIMLTVYSPGTISAIMVSFLKDGVGEGKLRVVKEEHIKSVKEKE